MVGKPRETVAQTTVSNRDNKKGRSTMDRQSVNQVSVVENKYIFGDRHTIEVKHQVNGSVPFITSLGKAAYTTKRQKELIDMIERFSRVSFPGTGKREATEWIVQQYRLLPYLNQIIRIPIQYEIYMADLQGHDNIQDGMRPVVVVQGNKGNVHSPVTLVIPGTKSESFLPTAFYIDLDYRTQFMCHQMTSIQVSTELKYRIGSMTVGQIRDYKRALAQELDLSIIE